MVVPGIAIGGSVALMLTGLARGLLFGLTPTEPGVFLLAASILGASALVAGWVPARRASSVDPLVCAATRIRTPNNQPQLPRRTLIYLGFGSLGIGS